MKLKFADFTRTTVERAGLAPSLGDYRSLLAEAFARTGKSVRLLGVGVRFAPLALPEAAQLALLSSRLRRRLLRSTRPGITIPLRLYPSRVVIRSFQSTPRSTGTRYRGPLTRVRRQIAGSADRRAADPSFGSTFRYP